jgi:hypothetical protein
MNSILYYPLQLGLVGAGVFAIHASARQGASRRRVELVGATAAGVIGWVGTHISQPRIDILGDFYQAYYPGARAALAGRGAMRALLAAHTPDTAVFGFVNLPIVAWLFTPFAALGRPLGGQVYTALGILLILWTWRALARLAELDTVRANVLLCLFAANGPLHYSLKEGNTSHVVLAGIVFALTRARRGSSWLGGAVLGVCALLKLPLVVLGAYFVVRRRLREAAGMAAVLGAAFALSVLAYGVETHEFWYRTYVAPFAKNPMPAYNVQSIHAFLERFDAGATHLYHWSPTPMALWARLVASTAVAGLWIATVFLGRRASFSSVAPEHRIPFEWSLVLGLAILGGPMAWSHYFAWFLLPAAYLLRQAPLFIASPRLRVLGGVGYLLAALPAAVPTLRSPWQEYFVSSLLSHYLLGGLLVMVCLLASGARPARAERTTV